MSVSLNDVRRIAQLARIGIDDERMLRMTGELNGILEHMNALAEVDTTGVEPSLGVGAAQMPLRADDGPKLPMARPLESIAPAIRDGLLLVPRLSSHAE